jgi:glutaredoxin 3
VSGTIVGSFLSASLDLRHPYDVCSVRAYRIYQLESNERTNTRRIPTGRSGGMTQHIIVTSSTLYSSEPPTSNRTRNTPALSLSHYSRIEPNSRMKLVSRSFCTLAWTCGAAQAWSVAPRTVARNRPAWVAARHPHTPTACAFSTTTRLAATPAEFAQTEIDTHAVVVFSKSRCPFCLATKSLLNDLKVDGVIVHELDQMDDGADVQAALATLTGQRTVPNVFVGGQHVGGNDDTQAAAASGKLQDMLAAAQAK